MTRIFTLLVFVFLSFTVWSQDAIRSTDPIPDQKAILVIPGISAEQLQTIQAEFANYSEITKAVYVFDNHNCLLVNVEKNEVIKFYSDLMKIILASTTISEQQISIKTSSAYNELMPKDLSHESSTFFIVK